MDAKCPYCTTVFPTDHSGPQACPQCGSQVNVEAPVPALEAGPGPRFELPPGGAPPSPPPPPPTGGNVPWERQKELGLLSAFGQTLSQSITRPEAFFASVRPQGPLLPALIYGWIITGITSLLNLPFQMMVLGWMEESNLEAFPPAAQEYLHKYLEESGHSSVLLVRTLGAILLFPLGMFIFAGVLHLFCLMWGAGKNGFAATFRALCYSLGPNLFSFVPCLGLFAALYTSVLMLIGIKEVQQTTYGRVVGATVTPSLICCCCGGAILASVGMAVFSQFRS